MAKRQRVCEELDFGGTAFALEGGGKRRESLVCLAVSRDADLEPENFAKIATIGRARRRKIAYFCLTGPSTRRASSKT